MKCVVASVFAITLVATGAAAAPTGWQTFTNHEATCQASVPADWKPGEYHIGMNASHGQGNVMISSSKADVGMAKQIASSTFHVTKVVEDSKSRYWVQYSSNGPQLPPNNYYVALQQPGFICAMQLSFDASLSDADAKEIVASLKKH